MDQNTISTGRASENDTGHTGDSSGSNTRQVEWGQKTGERDWGMTNRPMIKGWSDWENLGRAWVEKGKGSSQQRECWEDTRNFCFRKQSCVGFPRFILWQWQLSICPTAPLSQQTNAIKTVSRNESSSCSRRTTKLSAKTVVQNSENSCPVTSPSTKQTHKELKTFVSYFHQFQNLCSSSAFT